MQSEFLKLAGATENENKYYLNKYLFYLIYLRKVYALLGM